MTTAQQKPKKDHTLALVLSITALCVLVLGAAGYFVLFGWKHFNVTQQEADVACQQFYTKIETQVKAAQGYKVLSGKKSCTSNTDEMGSTDYPLQATFKVIKQPITTAEITKSDLSDLYRAINSKEPVRVDNTLYVPNQPQIMIVEGDVLFDNDGSYYREFAAAGPHYFSQADLLKYSH